MRRGGTLSSSPLLSFVRILRAALPLFDAAGGGRVVNLASSSAKQAIDTLLLSNTFRLGVVGLTKTLARELGPRGILVNCVGPGRIATERLEQLDRLWSERAGISQDAFRKRIEVDIPLGRYGRPDEFARLVVFLCSRANTYITGQTLLADGGMARAY